MSAFMIHYPLTTQITKVFMIDEFTAPPFCSVDNACHFELIKKIFSGCSRTKTCNELTSSTAKAKQKYVDMCCDVLRVIQRRQM